MMHSFSQHTTFEKKLIITIALSCLFTSFFAFSNAYGDTRFKRKCPFSCKSVGIDKKFCADSKEGDKCIVNLKSGVTGQGKFKAKRKCPLSCKSLNAGKSCKDWKEKDKCVVSL